jgi:hypothetical protein
MIQGWGKMGSDPIMGPNVAYDYLACKNNGVRPH